MNKTLQQNFNESGLLAHVIDAFISLVREDSDSENGGYALGEWRHGLEVIYWCLKGNPGGIVIARDLGLLQWLLQIACVELPFGEYKEEVNLEDYSDDENDERAKEMMGASHEEVSCCVELDFFMC